MLHVRKSVRYHWECSNRSFQTGEMASTWGISVISQYTKQAVADSPQEVIPSLGNGWCLTRN
jgi:hypothetical protein